MCMRSFPDSCLLYTRKGLPFRSPKNNTKSSIRYTKVFNMVLTFSAIFTLACMCHNIGRSNFISIQNSRQRRYGVRNYKILERKSMYSIQLGRVKVEDAWNWSFSLDSVVLHNHVPVRSVHKERIHCTKKLWNQQYRVKYSLSAQLSIYIAVSLFYTLRAFVSRICIPEWHISLLASVVAGCTAADRSYSNCLAMGLYLAFSN